MDARQPGPSKALRLLAHATPHDDQQRHPNALVTGRTNS